MCLLIAATVEDSLHWTLAMQTHKRRLELSLACMRLTNYGHGGWSTQNTFHYSAVRISSFHLGLKSLMLEYQTVPSATPAFTACLISALSFLLISALLKLDSVRGAEINSLCRHDFYRPYKIIVSYTLQYCSWFDSRTFIYGQNPLNLRVRLLPNFYQRFL